MLSFRLDHSKLLGTMQDTGYSEYEIERLKNIKRNEEYLQQMGFERKSTVVKTKPLKRKKVEPEFIEPARRSSRVANQEPIIYTEVSNASMRCDSSRTHFLFPFYMSAADCSLVTEF